MISRKWWLFFTAAFSIMAIINFIDGNVGWGVFESALAVIYTIVFYMTKEDE